MNPLVAVFFLVAPQFFMLIFTKKVTMQAKIPLLLCSSQFMLSGLEPLAPSYCGGHHARRPPRKAKGAATISSAQHAIMNPPLAALKERVREDLRYPIPGNRESGCMYARERSRMHRRRCLTHDFVDARHGADAGALQPKEVAGS